MTPGLVTNVTGMPVYAEDNLIACRALGLK